MRVANVLSRRAMLWQDEVLPTEDRTEHVRAASGVVWLGERLAVIQDDASFLAMVDPHSARATSIALGEGPVRRFEKALGNKADKLDLESCIAWSDAEGHHLLAFGSGSTEKRERAVHVCGARVEVVDLHGMYDALRALHAFAGDELNIEGAVSLGERVRLFQRGNGRGVARDATIEVVRDGWRPLPETVREYHLGTLDGVRLTFTDATLGPNGDVWFLACAEDSPNTYDDGRVVGSVIGRFDASGAVARMLRLVDADGPVAAKTEGIVRAGPGRAWVVVDMDDPSRPAELLEVDVSAL